MIRLYKCTQCGKPRGLRDEEPKTCEACGGEMILRRKYYEAKP